MYARAIDAPKRYQWATDSQFSQPYNCGPTCITGIAGFYTDRYFGIEATRKVIAGMGPYNVNGVYYYGAPQGTATNSWQQADMLRKRGVPCSVFQIDSLAQLHNLVDNGRRPLLVGIQMSRVPDSVRDHPFTGWHAVVVLTGVPGGFLVTDPNFSVAGSYRPDPDRGRKYYSDGTMQYAFIANSPRWSVIPSKPKVIATPDTSMGDELAILDKLEIPGDVGRLFDVRKGIQLRKGPGLTFAKHYLTTVPVKYRLVGFATLNGKRTGWVGASNPNSPTGIFFAPPDH